MSGSDPFEGREVLEVSSEKCEALKKSPGPLQRLPRVSVIHVPTLK